jgi:hypothetical protein
MIDGIQWNLPLALLTPISSLFGRSPFGSFRVKTGGIHTIGSVQCFETRVVTGLYPLAD